MRWEAGPTKKRRAIPPQRARFHEDNLTAPTRRVNNKSSEKQKNICTL
jgi:hypothetical protein